MHRGSKWKCIKQCYIASITLLQVVFRPDRGEMLAGFGELWLHGEQWLWVLLPGRTLCILCPCTCVVGPWGAVAGTGSGGELAPEGHDGVSSSPEQGWLPVWKVGFSQASYRALCRGDGDSSRLGTARRLV